MKLYIECHGYLLWRWRDEAGATGEIVDLIDLYDVISTHEDSEIIVLMHGKRIGGIDELPTFDGLDPIDTRGVWSWDSTHAIVGTCAADLEIVRRTDVDCLGWEYVEDRP